MPLLTLPVYKHSLGLDVFRLTRSYLWLTKMLNAAMTQLGVSTVTVTNWVNFEPSLTAAPALRDPTINLNVVPTIGHLIASMQLVIFHCNFYSR